MTAYNKVIIDSRCPLCGVPYDWGFDVEEGDKLGKKVAIGDFLPFYKEQLPSGNWETMGLGYCPNCFCYLNLRCEFFGAKLLRTGQPFVDL